MEHPIDFSTTADYAYQDAQYASDAAGRNSDRIKRLIDLLITKGVITREEIYGTGLEYHFVNSSDRQ